MTPHFLFYTLIIFLVIIAALVLWHLFVTYKRLTQMQKELYELHKQKCAFIQAQERAASLTKHKINL
ncbi:hypothetical protein [Acinetobacter towneri]|uniref:hypothetical protein n=1 Tax=Acinetobacter towneri TaxID=202956 RepID=UPI003A890549